MRYPEFIRPGDTIAYAAPSFGASSEPYFSAFENARKKLKALGFREQLGPNVYKSDGVGISTDPESCGKELTDLYLDPQNQAIFSVGGGELMCTDLPYVNWEALKQAKPKWFTGYSDNTNFDYLSATILDTAALYSYCAGTYGMEPWDGSVQDALSLLEGNLSVHGYEYWEKDSCKDALHPYEPFNKTEKTEPVFVNWDGRPVSGRFIGGCMDCLITLLGTEFDRTADFLKKYKEDGFIWFLEACDLNVLSIRRAVWQMKHAGWFRHVKAFLIGRPVVFGSEIFGMDHREAVLSELRELGVPVLLDLDIGHCAPMMTLITGGYGTVSPYSNNIRVDFELR